MKKDFQKWHTEKSEIHENRPRLFFQEREVWSTSTGLNIGFEIDGKGKKFLRPVVVVKKFNNESFWGISLTRNPRKGKYYFTFSAVENQSSTANLSQLRLIDAKRLQYKIGVMTLDDYKGIKEKLRSLIT